MQVEEMLVSAVMPIYRLPLGQYGYTGHIINLPQDVVSFAQSLPRSWCVGCTEGKWAIYHDFHVKGAIVQDALTE